MPRRALDENGAVTGELRALAKAGSWMMWSADSSATGWRQEKKTPPSSCFDCSSGPGQNMWDKRVAFDFQLSRVGRNRRCASPNGSIYSPSSLVAGHEQGRVKSNSSLAKNVTHLAASSVPVLGSRLTKLNEHELRSTGQRQARGCRAPGCHRLQYLPKFAPVWFNEPAALLCHTRTTKLK
jgi:hypothetical protein